MNSFYGSIGYTTDPLFHYFSLVNHFHTFLSNSNPRLLWKWRWTDDINVVSRSILTPSPISRELPLSGGPYESGAGKQARYQIHNRYI